MKSIEYLQSVGMLFPTHAGIQIDLNVVETAKSRRIRKETMLCDHNCTSEVGGYDCPAAYTHNKGAKGAFSPASHIMRRIKWGVEGIAYAREQFLNHGFMEYISAFSIPTDIAVALESHMRVGVVEVNLFGGNPEMHPDVLMLIHEIKAMGSKVTLTTTGRKCLRDDQFVQRFLIDPPDLLALSADDFQSDQLSILLTMTPRELQNAWQRIPKDHGQQQKCLEAIYTARIMAEAQNLHILLNMVLHAGNLKDFFSLFNQLTRSFPDVLMNPYPMQTHFQSKDSSWGYEELTYFESIVDFILNETLKDNSQLRKRLHYWLVMKSVLETYRGRWEIAANLISGKLWKCYQRPGAMYLQIGRGPDWIALEENEAPGLRCGCFWNTQTVTQAGQFHSAQECASYLMNVDVMALSSSVPCNGCAMPRLMFDMVTTELGLEDSLIPAYKQLRKEYIGF